MKISSGQPRPFAATKSQGNAAAPVLSGPRAHLSLAAAPAIRLALPSTSVPEAWQQGLDLLVNWLGVDLAVAPPPTQRRFGQLAEWAAPSGIPAQTAIFAPWQATIHPQPGGGARAQASWVASYLFDYGAASLSRRGPRDIMVMSPLAASCSEPREGAAPLPPLRLMKAMIAAAKAQGHSKLTIIADGASRNTVAAQLLRAERALTREDIVISILSVEDAVRALARHVDEWDALIVMPQWRSVIVALLAELSEITQPWPLMWFRRGLQRVTSEVVATTRTVPGCDASLLVLSLGAALRQQGQAFAASELYDAAARLWERGVTTPSRPSPAPYAHQLSDAEFLEQITMTPPVSKGRAPHPWLALAGEEPAQRLRTVPDLRLVGPA